MVKEESIQDGENVILDESLPDSVQMLFAAYDANGKFAGSLVCTAEEINAAKTKNGAEITFVQADLRKLFLLSADFSPIYGPIGF